MGEPSLQRTSELLRAVFQILWKIPNGLPAREVMDTLATKIKLTDFEKSLIPSTSTPQYEKIVRSATNTLVEVGWFIKNKDRWYLSDDGRTTCRNIKSAEEIYKAALLQCEEKKQLRDDVLLTIEDAEEKAWQKIWRYLNEMNPIEFKYLVGDLLKALNYHLDWIAPPGKNHGYIDIIAYPNPFGDSGTRVKVHVRHKGQAATIEGLKAFLGVLTPNDLGIYVSSGGFTDLVADEARMIELRTIRLISLENFFHLWVQNYEKLSQEAKHRFPLKPIYFLAPEK